VIVVLMPNEQFFSFRIVRTSCISKRWWCMAA